MWMLASSVVRTPQLGRITTSPQEASRARKREMRTEEPPAKRPKTAPSAGGESPPLPGSRMLHQTLLVVLFLVRVGVRSGHGDASFSQIGRMVQAHVDSAFHKYHEMISCKLESFQGQIEGLQREVRQLARMCSNRYADQQARVEPNQEHAAANGSNTNIRLCFLNGLKPPIYTDKDITDENNAPIKVAVFKGDEMITTGPLSEAEIEIVVLRSDFYNKCRDNWTEEEFDKYIVQGRNEKALVLGTVWLTKGEIELSKIRFKEGSCRREFIMGARVCKSQKNAGRVQEAIMKPVTVLDRRNEPNEKSHPPRLYDDVYRLEEIGRNGAYRKRLKEAKIFTVQDLLKALNKDSDELCKILQMKKKRKSWLKMTGHARERILEDKHELKTYQTEDANVVLFFNCVHDLVGARFRGNYIACETFDAAQKALVNKLKEHAYNVLEGIPADYVMKGNAPERISSGTDVPAGPSVVPVDAWQPVLFADSLEAYQGTGAAENWPRDETNLVTEPVYPNANYGRMNTGPDDHGLNTHDYQGLGTAQLCEQQINAASIGPDWQQNSQGPVDSPDLFDLELVSMMLQHPSGASTSDQPNLELPHHLPQLHPTVPAAAPAWQPSCAEHEQGRSCSAFPGSGHGNDG